MRRGNASAPPRVSGRQGQRDADAEAQLSRLGLVLAVLAVAANGCVQPDEWFQSVEIAARDVFGAKIWTPWEFGGSAALGDAVHEPCRSVSFPAVAAHAPLFLLRLCGGSIAWPRLIMMIPRLWALVISILVHDRLLGEVWRAAGLDDEGVQELAQRAELFTFQAGANVVSEGELGTHLFVVKDAFRNLTPSRLYRKMKTKWKGSQI